MPTTDPPVSAELARSIGHEVRALVTEAVRRRVLALRAYVGSPGGVRVELALPTGPWARRPLPGLRADLVERALDGLDDVPGLCGWVTRSGSLEPTDVDLAWRTAALEGFARHGCPLPAFFLLNRNSWVDLLGGDSRSWVRLRPHPSPSTRD